MPRIRLLRPDNATADARASRASGRHRADPDVTRARTSSHAGRKRWSAGFAVIAVVVGAMGALAPSASATLAAGGVGPTDPASLFPSYYQDTNGLRLQMCEDGPPLCLGGGPDIADKIQSVHAAGGDAESFYFQATADVGGFTVDMALEAAYAADGPDQEMVFQRRQATGKGVARSAKFTISDPYGTYTCTSDSTGLVQPARGCRFETAAAAGDFTSALRGPIGPFLTWDTFGGPGGPPAGYIGDAVTPHKVIGSAGGFNKIQVSGPGIVGTCIGPDGSTVDNCDETELITLQGKVQPGGSVGQLSTGTLDFGDTATPATKTLTYANVGDAPITINAPTTSGPGAAAYSVTNNCPVAPDTLLTGSRCTIDVTFTPDPGKSSLATLAITDDTPVTPRNVALTGSNLGVMTVADPPPPAGLQFGTVSVGSTSLEDNVVIANTGNGPLTVSTIGLTGASAPQYKLGPNNTCTGTGITVAPDSGCEIGVQFVPTTTGSKTANLRVTDSNGKIVNIPLNGTGSVQQVPGAPTNVAGTPGNASAAVTWTAPLNSGASAITGYSVRVLQGGVQVGTDRPATGTSLNVTGLTNGTAYTFVVAATNSNGTGAFSAPSAAVTPKAAVPGAPTGATATAGNAQATVRWTAPATNGGAAITGYTVRTFNGVSGAAVGTPLTVGNVTTATVAGLTNGTSVVFDVAAINSSGTGAFSTRSTAVTPSAPDTQVPTAPTLSGSVTGTTANLSWTASTDNVGVTGYQVLRNGVEVGTTTAATRTFSQTGLAAGTYSYTVRAVDAAGNQSVVSNTQSVTVAAANPAPTLTGRAPAVNGFSVAVANNITATFSEAVTGVTTTTFAIRPAATPTSAPIGGTVTQSTTVANQWILNPTANLAADTRYTVTLTGGAAAIRDTAGAALTTTSWSFTTGPAPTVTARTPAVNAVGVVRANNITATFSEAVNGVSTTTFVIRPAATPTATPIAGTVTRNGTTNQWILNPTASLAANTQYRVTVTGGSAAVRDLAGNPLVNVTWTFTTGA